MGDLLWLWRGGAARTKYLPFDVTVNGLNSKVRAGDALRMELGPILNPVSGAAEEIYLDKPTGFTSEAR